MKTTIGTNKRGWVAGFIVRFLGKNPDLAKEIFKEIFPDQHLARNPKKGRKNKVKVVCVEQADDKGGTSNG